MPSVPRRLRLPQAEARHGAARGRGPRHRPRRGRSSSATAGATSPWPRPSARRGILVKTGYGATEALKPPPGMSRRRRVRRSHRRRGLAARSSGGLTPWPDLVTLDELDALVAADRAAGRTIALANGVFDLLHVGHIRYLEGAEAEADVLDRRGQRRRVGAGAEGRGAARDGGRPIAPNSSRRCAASTTSSLFPGRTVDRRPAAPQARRALQGHRLHRRDRARAARSSQSYGGRTAIVGDPEGPLDARPAVAAAAALNGPIRPRSSGSAPWATSCTRCPRWRRCAPRGPRRASTGSSTRGTPRCSSSCPSSIAPWSSAGGGAARRRSRDPRRCGARATTWRSTCRA